MKKGLRQFSMLLLAGVLAAAMAEAARAEPAKQDEASDAGAPAETVQAPEAPAVPKECAVLEQKITSLAADRNNILAQVQVAYQEKKEAREELEKAQKQIKELTAERDKLQGEVTQAKQQAFEQVDSMYQKNSEMAGRLRTALWSGGSPAKPSAEEGEPLLSKPPILEEKEPQAASVSFGPLPKVEKQLPETKQGESAAELAAERRERAAVEKKVKSLEEEIADLKRQLEQAKKEKTEAVQAADELKKAATDVPGKVQEISRENERLRSENAQLHYNVGVVLVRQREYERAAKEFQRAVELAPDQPLSYFNLGKLYSEYLDDSQKAVSYFEHYLQLRPDADDADWVKQNIAVHKAWKGDDKLL